MSNINPFAVDSDDDEQYSSVLSTTTTTMNVSPSTSTPATTLPNVDDAVSSSALRAGIRAIAVGKYGEKPIPLDVVDSIEQELSMIEQQIHDNSQQSQQHQQHGISRDLLYLRASFLGALFMKRTLHPYEAALLHRTVVLPRTAAYRRGRERSGGESGDEMLTISAGHVLATVVTDLDLDNDNGNDSDNETTTKHTLNRFALRLLCDERLDRKEALQLGRILYGCSKNNPPTPVMALVAHVMRVRHETNDELSGLAAAVRETTVKLDHLNSSSFARNGNGASTITTSATTNNSSSSTSSEKLQANDNRYFLLSEPFDGAITWDMLTPLLARHLTQAYASSGFKVIVPCGQTSGPKYGPNVHALYHEMDKQQQQQQANDNSGNDMGCYEIVSDQEDSNEGLAQWVHMRRVIMKRPALATVEKFADPVPRASSRTVLVSSAFHPGYVDKMAYIARHLGYRAFIIVAKGAEGSIGQLPPPSPSPSPSAEGGDNANGSSGSTTRTYSAFVGWAEDTHSKDDEHEVGHEARQYGSQWVSFTYDARTSSSSSATPEKGQASVVETARKIRQFVQSEGLSSGDSIFDMRVEVTCQLLDRAVSVIQDHVPALFIQK